MVRKIQQRKLSYIAMNSEARENVFQKLERMKGGIYRGNALERIINTIYEANN